MKEGRISELEKTLLDQIEALNDLSICKSAEEVSLLVDRSKAMSDLAGNVIDIYKLKIEAVKLSEDNSGLYDKYLGIEG